MPRIPGSELERLKREVSLERLCERYGIELKAHGKDKIAHCPFHDDRSPSFVVSPEKNLWHCLGACTCGGSNIDLVMKKEGVSFRHAVERLRQMLGLLPEAAQTIRTGNGVEYPILVKPSDEMTDSELLRHVIGYYHETFLNQPEAMEYLQRRAALHPEAVKRFRLGYSNRTLGYRIPPKATTEGGKIRRPLHRMGILRESGHEHFRGSVVIPLYDRAGVAVQMYGRKISSELASDVVKHIYLPRPLAGIFNLEGLVQQKEWLLCEALIDALTLWSAGLRNVTSTYGVNGWTEEYWQLIEELKPERIIFCFDNDEAGNQAAEKLGLELAGRGIEIRRAKLPPDKDINDVARKSKNPASALAAVIEGAGAMFVAHRKASSEEPAVNEARSVVEEEGGQTHVKRTPNKTAERGCHQAMPSAPGPRGIGRLSWISARRASNGHECAKRRVYRVWDRKRLGANAKRFATRRTS